MPMRADLRLLGVVTGVAPVDEGPLVQVEVRLDSGSGTSIFVLPANAPSRGDRVTVEFGGDPRRATLTIVPRGAE